MKVLSQMQKNALPAPSLGVTRSRSTFRGAVILPLMLTALVGAGCRKPEVELASVHGVVQLDGKPLPNATIRFVPLGKGRAALGRTDENGRYEMKYSAKSDGAVVGKVRVEITTAEEIDNPDGNARMGKEILPAKYHENSELEADVGNRSNTIDFELHSK